MPERIIGIDFGTSTSVVRVRSYDDNGKALGDVKAVKEPNGADTIPTLIRRLDVGGAPYYGANAKQPKRDSKLHQNFKLKLKSENSAEKEQAQELTEEFFKYIYRQYSYQSNQGHLGESGERERTIVSYPVKWDYETRRFMVEAAKKAGFSNVEDVDEAQAAIWAALVRCENYLAEKKYFKQNESTNILLIDMGAGTTDIVVCRYTYGDNPKNEILCTWPKDENILFGGSEVDKILKDYVFSKIPSDVPEDIIERINEKVGVKEFKAWKEELVSEALRKNENVTDCSYIELFLDVEFCLDRSEFERIAADYLNEFPKLVNGAISHSGLKNEEIDLVIVTGGHSQWYFVKEMLKGRIGSVNLPKIKSDDDRIISLALPQETVATGLVFEPSAKSWISKKVTRLTPSGHIYEGDIKNGVFNGKGKLIFTDGGVYEGEFVNGMPAGEGKMIMAIGAVYEGELSNGKFSGKGKMTLNDGTVYEGDFVNGIGCGKGRLITANGDVYEGDFEDNNLNGKGKMTMVNGNIYEGDFENNVFHGKGKLNYANGDVYEGEFENGNINGNGRYVYANGDVYDGELRDNKAHGKGKLITSKGYVYGGEFENNKYKTSLLSSCIESHPLKQLKKWWNKL